MATRVYPDDLVVPADEALRIRDERRLRALGIARAKAPKSPMEPNDEGGAGEPGGCPRVLVRLDAPRPAEGSFTGHDWTRG